MNPAAGGGTGTAGDGARTRGAGAYAVDVRDGRAGRAAGHVGGYVRLRPPGGGREGDRPPGATAPAAPAPAAPDAVLRARVREPNRACLC
ncbi:hypothetical protein LUX12_04970 [Streptomyces somaliensis]|uniref:hypothetical protein n=1 Tax=Streptomyces somaliensis TaxID=78355 RepID=UPI0020CE77CB|nr:hypothetical protein [Streptomyces somaliensis]MCP9944287.1 hypothetical protein [Streptomyces somaliensis]